jgi:hypothetical protein
LSKYVFSFVALRQKKKYETVYLLLFEFICFFFKFRFQELRKKIREIRKLFIFDVEKLN